MPEALGREGERALVAAILAGDERAFEKLYADVKPRLLRAAGVGQILMGPMPLQSSMA